MQCACKKIETFFKFWDGSFWKCLELSTFKIAEALLHVISNVFFSQHNHSVTFSDRRGNSVGTGYSCHRLCGRDFFPLGIFTLLFYICESFFRILLIRAIIRVVTDSFLLPLKSTEKLHLNLSGVRLDLLSPIYTNHARNLFI